MASIIYNVIVKKMGGIDDVCAVMKVHFYLYAYAAVYYTVGYIILASIFILTYFYCSYWNTPVGECDLKLRPLMDICRTLF